MYGCVVLYSLSDFASAGLSAPVLVRLDAERRILPDLCLAFLTTRVDEKVSGVWMYCAVCAGALGCRTLHLT